MRTALGVQRLAVCGRPRPTFTLCPLFGEGSWSMVLPVEGCRYLDRSIVLSGEGA